MILIIDFGSQYNQLIARRVREFHVYCRIDAPGISIDEIKALNPDGIILSGGPASIYEKNSPKADPAIFDLGIPVLGICYGMHFMISALGGTVERVGKREYGFAELEVKKTGGLFEGVDEKSTCWMSHGDSIRKLPGGFETTAATRHILVLFGDNNSAKIKADTTYRPESSGFFWLSHLRREKAQTYWRRERDSNPRWSY